MTGPGAPRPRVVVLMATYNGGEWVEQQVDSILAQKGVDVRLLVSDDGSSDSTCDVIRRYVETDPRVTLLPPRNGPSGVTANFLHLFTHACPENGEYVAFSDQDDLWVDNKLDHQVRLLEATSSGVVSSDVLSFSADGLSTPIVKSQPQRRWDFIFEAAGPGSTYVFSPELHRQLCMVLDDIGYEGISVHDWYLYALVRALGVKWTIDSTPTVLYRQHDANVIGANSGLSAIRSRLKDLRSGHYRQQFVRIAKACQQVGQGRHGSQWEEELSRLIACLSSTAFVDRLRLVPWTLALRRRPTQAFALVGLRLLGIW